jgi:hypothetical protein
MRMFSWTMHTKTKEVLVTYGKTLMLTDKRAYLRLPSHKSTGFYPVKVNS